MKKAFDQNVSRARPRLRLGALTEVADAAAAETQTETETQPAAALPPPPAPAQDLGAAVKARAERARAPRPRATEAVQRALEVTPAERLVAQATARVLDLDVETVTALAREEGAAPMAMMQQAAARAQAEVTTTAHAAPEPTRTQLSAPAPAAHFDPPHQEVEVQTPPAEHPVETLGPDARRERLKERLRAVRENPRPEPLPPTVAEAGVLAVERIASLQAELHKVKALNLALTQDLESTRRQAEKATEEARVRMDESRRLSTEIEGRLRLLQDLEKELASLEGERDDALLALQETRQGLAAAGEERLKLEEELARRDVSLTESLAEEERLCGELESAREEAQALRRSVEALSTERNTLARQVAELTAERAELLEARKALEAVHRALSTAAAR